MSENNNLKLHPLKSFLANLPHHPGIYQMLDETNTVLYVGKAKDLKKRVASYFNQSAKASSKTRALMAQVTHIDITVTHTESEALLLEHNLIKTHQPRYNILLRDDKSYPYLYLSNHPFPSLSLHRGTKKGKGRYFGPYPHAKAVYDSLNLLQKIFPLRQCQDHFFRHRSRPCLQYQIKRCSGPCVGLITPDRYQQEVQHAVWFLEGKSQTVIDILVQNMQMAAQSLEFETAARYRDQIKNLKQIQEHQYVDTEGGNVDIVVALMAEEVGCVQVLTVRAGRQLGNRAFFPKHTQGADSATLLAAFLPQYYLAAEREVPDEIILHEEIEEMAALAAAIKQQHGSTVHLHAGVRGIRAKWVAMALQNAKTSVAQRQPSRYRERLTALSVALQLTELPQRIDCFDVSHTQGEATVAACVVFDSEGPCKNAYQRFNIKNITPGDDYTALHQALTRHYSRLDQADTSTVLPDLLLLDGGAGQVRVAQQVLTELSLPMIRLVGIAKGPGRKPELDTLILPEQGRRLSLPSDSPALLLLQQIRDEAHRFAITSHRRQRAKIRRASILEQIAGIGPTRRRQLLNHFGGLSGIVRAGIEDLTTVPGISQSLAQKIYEFFRER